MKIVICNGGLANQIHQYVFSRYVAEKTGEEVLLDTFFFDKVDAHNGFELDRVFPNAKFKTTREYFGEEMWKSFHDSLTNLNYIPQALHENGYDVKVIIDKGSICSDRFFEDPLLAEEKVLEVETDSFFREDGIIQENKDFPCVYYAGYWIRFHFNRSVKYLLKEELQLPPIEDPVNLQYFRDIQSCYAVAIHVRRGDFLNPLKLFGLPASYYKGTILHLKNTLLKEKENVKFFVFSNDLDWCKANESDMGLTNENFCYVEGNFNFKTNYVDMQLMMECPTIIASRSAFCKSAWFLSEKVEHYVAAPSRNHKFYVE